MSEATVSQSISKLQELNIPELLVADCCKNGLPSSCHHGNPYAMPFKRMHLIQGWSSAPDGSVTISSACQGKMLLQVLLCKVYTVTVCLAQF